MEWQPIDTAPFNTPVLITDGRDVYIASKRKEAWRAIGASGWDCENDFFNEDLTHWMPCPELPK